MSPYLPFLIGEVLGLVIFAFVLLGCYYAYRWWNTRP